MQKGENIKRSKAESPLAKKTMHISLQDFSKSGQKKDLLQTRQVK